MTTLSQIGRVLLFVPLLGWPLGSAVSAQTTAPAPAPPTSGTPKPAPPAPSTAKPAPPAPGTAKPTTPDSVTAAAKAGITTSADYVIGPGDVLTVVFWREPEMSVEAVVRPDGRISIPLLDDIDVVNLTPEQLKQKLIIAAQRVVQDPNVTVVVKQINSRQVYITGQVGKPGPYPLLTTMNVLQLISTAGGLLEYANGKNIVIMRNEKGQTTNFLFNYKDMENRRNLKQNIELKPGDIVMVP
jgi:polysaccharide export outer membrane protein